MHGQMRLTHLPAEGIAIVGKPYVEKPGYDPALLLGTASALVCF